MWLIDSWAQLDPFLGQLLPPSQTRSMPSTLHPHPGNWCDSPAWHLHWDHGSPGLTLTLAFPSMRVTQVDRCARKGSGHAFHRALGCSKPGMPTGSAWVPMSPYSGTCLLQSSCNLHSPTALPNTNFHTGTAQPPHLLQKQPVPTPAWGSSKPGRRSDCPPSLRHLAEGHASRPRWGSSQATPLLSFHDLALGGPTHLHREGDTALC